MRQHFKIQDQSVNLVSYVLPLESTLEYDRVKSILALKTLHDHQLIDFILNLVITEGPQEEESRVDESIVALKVHGDNQDEFKASTGWLKRSMKDGD